MEPMPNFPGSWSRLEEVSSVVFCFQVLRRIQSLISVGHTIISQRTSTSVGHMIISQRTSTVSPPVQIAAVRPSGAQGRLRYRGPRGRIARGKSGRSTQSGRKQVKFALLQFKELALISALRAPMFCHLEFAILISPIARFDFDYSRSTRENRLYLECSIYIREIAVKLKIP